MLRDDGRGFRDGETRRRSVEYNCDQFRYVHSDIGTNYDYDSCNNYGF